MLSDFIISRVRVKILELFFLAPEKIFHVREIVRRIDEEINAVRRELAHLEKIGLLGKEHRANRLFYKLRREYPLYFDLLELITKTAGLGGEILKARTKLGKIKFAMVSGKFARKIPRSGNDVDLLIVGRVVLPELNQIIRQIEVKEEHEINYTVMTDDEFEFRKRRRDPFIIEILREARIMIIGDEVELVS